MKKLIAILALNAAFAMPAFAATGEGELDEAHNDVSDTASLQRGARYFVNYCLGCHSAQYVRYNRLAADLGISESELENLMFTGERSSDTMVSAMNPEDAERWFGISPPDLSLMARSAGTDHIYSFLRSFYAAPDRQTGVDNTVLPGTAMPNVLWQLQGVQTAVFSEPEGNAEPEFEHFEIESRGELSADEFDGVVRDIVNFLDYISEPIQLKRQSLGIRVIGFLLLFLVLAIALKKEIWKDVK